MKNLIRLKNLQLLAYEHCSQPTVAEKLEMNHSEIGPYYSGTRSVPDHRARYIEEKLDKPDGWMDRENYDLKITTEESELLKVFRSVTRKDKKIILALVEAINRNQNDGCERQ